MYDIQFTNAFKKDYKLLKKRGYNLDLLKDIVERLANGEELPSHNRDHSLTGNWIGFRECHIKPDWLLIYRIYDNTLVLSLTRTGTHSDLNL